jgi:hypothetical protein
VVLSLDGVVVGSLLDLPSGSYIISAKARLGMPDDEPAARAECTLDVAGLFSDFSAVVLRGPDPPPAATIPALVAAELPSGGSAVWTCSEPNLSDVPTITALDVKMTAIQVGSLEPQ